MAAFAATAAGRVAAGDLCKTRMAANTWIVGHMAVNESGATIVRFQRPKATTSDETREYAGWYTSTDTAAT